MKLSLKIRYLILILYFGSMNFCLSQVPELKYSVSIPKPESASIDRFNNIYITDSKGNIFQFDIRGNILQKYSPPKPAKISLLEAWQAIKIFAFSQDLQQILFLDRFLIPSPIVKLQDLSLGFIRTATISVDNNLWLIDDSDLSLKKYDLSRQKTIIHSPLNLQLTNNSFDINFAREHQNHLFINDKSNGIYMFDVLGNYLKTFPIIDLKYFNFLNDELYYLQDDKIRFFNFYKLQERIIDVPSGFLYSLATDKHLILISGTHLNIYNY